jgi:hypothetical protein
LLPSNTPGRDFLPTNRDLVGWYVPNPRTDGDSALREAGDARRGFGALGRAVLYIPNASKCINGRLYLVDVDRVSRFVYLSNLTSCQKYDKIVNRHKQ